MSLLSYFSLLTQHLIYTSGSNTRARNLYACDFWLRLFSDITIRKTFVGLTHLNVQRPNKVVLLTSPLVNLANLESFFLYYIQRHSRDPLLMEFSLSSVFLQETGAYPWQYVTWAELVSAETPHPIATVPLLHFVLCTSKSRVKYHTASFTQKHNQFHSTLLYWS